MRDEDFSTHVYSRNQDRQKEDPNIHKMLISERPKIDKEVLRQYQNILTSVFAYLIEQEGMPSQFPLTSEIHGNENWLENALRTYSTTIPSLFARTGTHGIRMTLNLEAGLLDLTVIKYKQEDITKIERAQPINKIPIEYETIMQTYKVGKEKLEI